MRFQAALTREQGVEFAVVAVGPRVVGSTREATDAMRAFQRVFAGVPVVLMAQDGRGRPTYYGRRDIVRFLASINFGRLPWREYTLN